MRTIKIDEKWSFKCIDVNDGMAGIYSAPVAYRYNEETQLDPNNLEIAMAQRIMELEDLLEQEYKS